MDSITATTNVLQAPKDELVEPLAIDEASGNGEQPSTSAMLPIARDSNSQEEPKEETTGTLFNKYGYDEFMGPGGKRLLDRILQQVLTYANWRTWHFADEFVAPGNDCYVGPYRLAAEIRPGIRKVEMDFKALRELGLMTVYPDYRLVKQADTGKTTMQAVIIKDFTALYALAHEYYLWEKSPHYIPPERQYAPLILKDEELTQKLLRFDNYRRVLACHKPGRKPQGTEPLPSHATLSAIAAQDAQNTTARTDPKQFSNTGEKTLSLNRISRNPQMNLLQDSTSNAQKKEEFLSSQQAIGNSTELLPEREQSMHFVQSEQATPSKSNTLPPTQEEKLAETAKDVKREVGKMTAQEKAAAALAHVIPSEHWQEMNQPKQAAESRASAPARPRWHTPDWLAREIAMHAQQLGDDPKVLGSVVTRASKITRTIVEIFDVEADGERAELIRKAIRQARTRTQRRIKKINPKRRMPYLLECFINSWGLKPAELLYLESDEPLYQDGHIKDFMMRLYHSYERSGSRSTFDEWAEARLDQERARKKRQ